MCPTVNYAISRTFLILITACAVLILQMREERLGEVKYPKVTQTVILGQSSSLKFMVFPFIRC